MWNWSIRPPQIAVLEQEYHCLIIFISWSKSGTLLNSCSVVYHICFLCSLHLLKKMPKLQENCYDLILIWCSCHSLTVSLNSADAIREAFLKSEDFSDRGMFGELFDLHDREYQPHKNNMYTNVLLMSGTYRMYLGVNRSKTVCVEASFIRMPSLPIQEIRPGPGGGKPVLGVLPHFRLFRQIVDLFGCFRTLGGCFCTSCSPSPGYRPARVSSVDAIFIMLRKNSSIVHTKLNVSFREHGKMLKINATILRATWPIAAEQHTLMA